MLQSKLREEAQKIHQRIVELSTGSIYKFWELGEALYHLNTDRKYTYLGYPTFPEYLKAMHLETNGWQLIKIYTVFQKEDVENIGFDKAKEIADVAFLLPLNRQKELISKIKAHPEALDEILDNYRKSVYLEKVEKVWFIRGSAMQIQHIRDMVDELREQGYGSKIVEILENALTELTLSCPKPKEKKYKYDPSKFM